MWHHRSGIGHKGRGQWRGADHRIHLGNQPPGETAMQVLRRRCENQLNRQTQHITRPQASHHLVITPHVPNTKGPPFGRTLGQPNRLSQAHTLNTVGQGCAAISQTPLRQLNRHQRINRSRHPRVAFFKIEDNNLRISVLTRRCVSASGCRRHVCVGMCVCMCGHEKIQLPYPCADG